MESVTYYINEQVDYLFPTQIALVKSVTSYRPPPFFSDSFATYKKDVLPQIELTTISGINNYSFN